MYGRFLLPLGGSELGESVIPHADALARQMSLDVEVVGVVPTATMAYPSGLEEAGLKATSTALQGHAPTQIIGQVDAAEGTLVVMSTHGCTGAGR